MFFKLKRGNRCCSWLVCCFSLLSKTDPFLSRWTERVQAVETVMGTANFVFPYYDLREAWGPKWSHSTNSCPGMGFHLWGRKKKPEQLYDPCTCCPVPGHPTLDEALYANAFRCLKNKRAHLCLAIEAFWLSAVSLALCFTNEALVGESRWFVFASVQWLSFVLCRKWLLPLKHLTNIWKSASTFCWEKELVTGISLYTFFLNKRDRTDVLFLSEYGRYEAESGLVTLAHLLCFFLSW